MASRNDLIEKDWHVVRAIGVIGKGEAPGGSVVTHPALAATDPKLDVVFSAGK